MTIGTQDLELKLIQRSAGIELDLLPLQGLWTEAQYLKLTNQTNRLIEFTDGVIEVLPMPTRSHQLILLLLYGLFNNYVRPAGGIVLVAPLRVQVRPGNFREPFGRGQTATSVLLAGFTIEVNAALDAQ